MARAARIAFWGLVALLATGVAVHAFFFAVRGAENAPPPIGDNTLPISVTIHAIAAGVALLIGAWQFVGAIRRKAPRIHRWIGRIYSAACIVGGAAGGAAALNASSGPIAQSGFFLLAVLWIATTGIGWRAAVRRDFAVHQDWMIRSFALALAAVTLRLYLPLPLVFGGDFFEAYRWIAWLCWVPNLLIAELYIRGRKRAAA